MSGFISLIYASVQYIFIDSILTVYYEQTVFNIIHHLLVLHSILLTIFKKHSLKTNLEIELT